MKRANSGGRRGSRARDLRIQNDVYRLACAGFAEKDGSFTNSSRWVAMEVCGRADAPAACKVDQEIVALIFLSCGNSTGKEGGKFPDPILNLSWSYTTPENPSLSEVAKEINGKALAISLTADPADDQGRSSNYLDSPG